MSSVAPMMTDALRCAHCGYDLRGLVENRCPECGNFFDPTRLPSAALPWLLEDEAGWSAYWRTAWRVLTRPWELGRLVWMPVAVDLARARQFRRSSVRLSLASLSAAAMLLARMMTRDPIMMLVALIGIVSFAWPFLELATGAGRDWKRWELNVQQSARFLNLYNFSCAALSLSPLVPVVIFTGGLLTLPPSVVFYFACATWIVIMFFWWLAEVNFHAASGRALFGDAVGAGITILVQWFAFTVAGAGFCVIAFLLTFAFLG